MVRRAKVWSAAWATVLSTVCMSAMGDSVAAAGARIASHTASTEHFVVHAAADESQVRRWAERCESLLQELRAKWMGDESELHWSPKCVVVVHGDAASYLREVPGGERTVGSSWIESERGRIVTRRIDVRGDRDDWMTGAMAHELIHVLLADRFPDGMPRWAEEGLALLADPPQKQALHDADFRSAAARRRQFRVVELVGLREYPPAERITTFYGQSASLVRYLAGRGRPADFLEFVERADREGYDAALQRVYALDNIAGLEAAWVRSLNVPQLAVD